MILRRLAVVLLVVYLGGRAAAEPPPGLQEAEVRFQRGVTLYEAGD
jgi:hypothetical protein